MIGFDDDGLVTECINIAVSDNEEEKQNEQPVN